MTTPVAAAPTTAASSPLPLPALRVGVLGARKFGPNDGPPPAWLSERLKQLFGLIACELNCLQRSEAHFDKTDRPLVRVVAGLADGADQAGARAALDAGHPETNFQADFELLAVLPFSPSEYEKTIDNKTEFSRL